MTPYHVPGEFCTAPATGEPESGEELLYCLHIPTVNCE